jgi:hypothetical protein
MYLDIGTIIGICIALSAQLILMTVLFHSVWKQHNYRSVTNDSFKIESSANDIWN